MENGTLTTASNTIALGRLGEELASEYLDAKGYTLVAANFTVPVGRNLRGALVQAEIDVVAYDGATLCFIEVKTRTSDWFASPEANVDLRKQRQVARAARAYRRLFGLQDAKYRFDVVTVTVSPKGIGGSEHVDVDVEVDTAAEADATAQSSPLRIELFKNFWRDDKFHRRTAGVPARPWEP